MGRNVWSGVEIDRPDRQANEMKSLPPAPPERPARRWFRLLSLAELHIGSGDGQTTNDQCDKEHVRFRTLQRRGVRPLRRGRPETTRSACRNRERIIVLRLWFAASSCCGFGWFGLVCVRVWECLLSHHRITRRVGHCKR